MCLILSLHSFFATATNDFHFTIGPIPSPYINLYRILLYVTCCKHWKDKNKNGCFQVCPKNDLKNIEMIKENEIY